jgi:hypothetical protein
MEKTNGTLSVEGISEHKEFPVGKVLTGNSLRDFPGEGIKSLFNTKGCTSVYKLWLARKPTKRTIVQLALTNILEAKYSACISRNGKAYGYKEYI